jgi:hypothetical protein
MRIERSLRWAARDLRRIVFVSFTIFTSLAAHHEGDMAISYEPTSIMPQRHEVPRNDSFESDIFPMRLRGPVNVQSGLLNL